MTRTTTTRRIPTGGRFRIVGWTVLTAAVGTALLLAALVLVLRWTADEEVNRSLARDREAVAAFAREGVDPETGEPATDPERFVDLYVDRHRVDPTELVIGGTDGDPDRRESVGVDAVSLADLAPDTRQALLAPDGGGTMTDPVHGPVTWTNVQVKAGDRTGHVVVAVFRQTGNDVLARQGLLLGLLALGSLAATGAAAWAAAGRFLDHTAEFDDAVRRSLEAPEPRTLPEEGSAEYRVLARRANALIRRGERDLRDERRFSEDLAFALRTPLTAIEEGLRHPGSTAEHREATRERLAAEATRVRSLVDGLVALVRLDRQDTAATPGPVDVAVLAGTAARSWHARTGGDGPEPAVDAVGETTTALADAPRLVQVLEAVLDNARNAAAPVAPVEIRVRVHEVTDDDGRWVAVDVVDHGRGVPEDERDLVLHRLATASNDPCPGNGLGLPIAAGLMAWMGGTLRLEEADDGGTRVRLLLRAVLDGE
ncbi:sensor histidine kinase [Micrococcus luteus]|uniref:sensor histidine kinase n=1 Tax=Micrococcus luteus TaxID=1270 RepID=UPI0020CBF8AA|nr:HAMP domain-containing sensor histidine kinase [Micrococcus luteus]UTT46455.1 HAMP domain-containing histidine kinase [Micrococcus luteus]